MEQLLPFSHHLGIGIFLIVKFIISVIGFIVLIPDLCNLITFTTVVWANLRILVEIPSLPVAFLRSNLLICLLINSSLMGLNSNDEGSVRLSLIFKILG